jgi:hypothetical protein
MNGYLHDHKKFLVALFFMMCTLVNKFDFDFDFDYFPLLVMLTVNTSERLDKLSANVYHFASYLFC